MHGTEHIRNEIQHYQILSAELKSHYEALDEETLRDTLEGISDLPDMIQAVIRTALDDEAFVKALKARQEDLQARLERLRERAEKKRELARWAMEMADLNKIEGPEFSISVRRSPPHLEILDEAAIPAEFRVAQPAKLDRTGLLWRLRQGEEIEGVSLGQGGNHISVRTK